MKTLYSLVVVAFPHHPKNLVDLVCREEKSLTDESLDRLKVVIQISTLADQLGIVLQVAQGELVKRPAAGEVTAVGQSPTAPLRHVLTVTVTCEYLVT